MLRTVAVSLLALAAVGAADDFEEFYLEEGLPWVDIRLGYGFVPRADEYSGVFTANTGATADFVYGVDDDTMQALSYTIIGGSMNPLGLIGGAELVYTWDSMKVTSSSLSGVGIPVPTPGASLQYRTIGGNVLLGAGLALSQNFHLEGLGLLGLAAVDMDTSNMPAADQDDGEGWSWCYGVRGGAYFTWRRLVIGACVDWTSTTTTFESNWANGNTRVDQDNSGVGGRIEIGYHIQ